MLMMMITVIGDALLYVCFKLVACVSLIKVHRNNSSLHLFFSNSVLLGDL